ncbi:MAG: holo-ACP synthase [Clostridiaceae bacterium]|nr:holo-ACP synthase [Clostridiaceae bacterium]
MIAGIGLDLVCTERVARLSPAAVARIFTHAERVHAAGRAETLAGIFAAKEALTKACGAGLLSVLRETEIQYSDAGSPRIAVSDNLAKRLGAVRFFVSITHDAGIAAAVVVAEIE